MILRSLASNILYIGGICVNKKIIKRINSFKYAIEGIKATFKSQTNMKIHVTVMLLVIIAGIILKLDSSKWKICIILFSLVLAGELFNTAIEAISQRCCCRWCTSTSNWCCNHWFNDLYARNYEIILRVDNLILFINKI